MVGSVLLDRMRDEKDFDHVKPTFFSTSQAGGAGPRIAGAASNVEDANDITALAKLPMLISTQGGDYTQAIHPKLRAAGWQGYWIDAASALRMQEHAVIVLDPVNLPVMQAAQARGIKDFIGGNCTVSLMLMAVAGLLRAGLVEWITAMTYQAASGAGAAKMLELVKQMECLTDPTRKSLSENALEVDRMVIERQRASSLPVVEFGVPVAGSLIPWIDKDMPGGQTKEEWKGMAEANKILALDPPVPIDGMCVRIGTMRCHSAALCIKLKKDIPLGEIEQILAAANPWVRVIPNTKDSTLRCLTPTAVSGTLNVPIGRLHKLNMGPEYLGAFTVGDQLLWGAAEPLRRMVGILRQHLGS
jgi:aspartate-semialdehyde dehydrogenase